MVASHRTVDYSRHMVEVVTTEDFDQWLTKLKDKAGRLRILKRIDRLVTGIPATSNRSVAACRSFASTWVPATASTTSATVMC